MFARETTTNSALTDTQVHIPLVAPADVGSDRFKRSCDVALCVAMCLPVMAIIGLIWLAVRSTSAGPGFYSQTRVGRYGRHYRIYKIRTMSHNCELTSGARWCLLQRDPRVTRLGRILRKLHLDELPQIWNVLRGDMSLVGPRPERPEFVEPLSEAIPGYDERHRVRPGVTGLAQIQLPADTDVESVRTKLVLDRHYIDNRSLWLDVRILFGTLVYLSGFSYASVRRVMRLPYPLEDVTEAGNRPKSASSVIGSVPATRPAKRPSKPDQDPVSCGKA